jgi:hypothetical protein
MGEYTGEALIRRTFLRTRVEARRSGGTAPGVQRRGPVSAIPFVQTSSTEHTWAENLIWRRARTGPSRAARIPTTSGKTGGSRPEHPHNTNHAPFTVGTEPNNAKHNKA